MSSKALAMASVKVSLGPVWRSSVVTGVPSMSSSSSSLDDSYIVRLAAKENSNLSKRNVGNIVCKEGKGMLVFPSKTSIT